MCVSGPPPWWVWPAVYRRLGATGMEEPRSSQDTARNLIPMSLDPPSPSLLGNNDVNTNCFFKYVVISKAYIIFSIKIPKVGSSKQWRTRTQGTAGCLLVTWSFWFYTESKTALLILLWQTTGKLRWCLCSQYEGFNLRLLMPASVYEKKELIFIVFRTTAEGDMQTLT